MDLAFGVDMASKSFECFNLDSGKRTVINTLLPIKAFLKTLPEGAVIAIESTGGYEKLLADTAVGMGFTVYILQPGKVRHFRKSGPDKGKTDKIDARAVHGYISTFKDRLHPYQPLPAFEDQLRKLTRTRSGLVNKVASLRKQLRALGDDLKTIERVLKSITERIAVLTKQIEKMLASAEDAKVLFKISGVKTCTVAAVLPCLRTISFKNKYALDSYVGLDLKPNESGNSKGRRHLSKEGDKYIRRALYIAAMAATRSKAWRDYYQMLLNEKKLKKVQALNALARKLLHAIFGVYKSQSQFARP